MNKGAQAIVAAFFLLISLLSLGAMVYLVFFFPRIMETWEELARELTTCEQMLAHLSDLCRRNGLILLPLEMLLSGVSTVWLVFSLITRKQS
jgi:type II secretory pathway component PulF